MQDDSALLDEYLRQIREVRRIQGQAHHRPAYRDLYIAATRMAEIQLYQCVKNNTPLPIGPGRKPRTGLTQWVSLLDGPMRARLRRVEVNPDDIEKGGV